MRCFQILSNLGRALDGAKRGDGSIRPSRPFNLAREWDYSNRGDHGQSRVVFSTWGGPTERTPALTQPAETDATVNGSDDWSRGHAAEAVREAHAPPREMAAEQRLFQ